MEDPDPASGPCLSPRGVPASDHLLVDLASGARYALGVTLDGTDLIVTLRVSPEGALRASEQGVLAFSLPIGPQALRLGRLLINDTGQLELDLRGAPDGPCRVQTSTDLIVWTDAGSLLIEDGQGRLQMARPSQDGHCFFRAVAP